MFMPVANVAATTLLAAATYMCSQPTSTQWRLSATQSFIIMMKVTEQSLETAITNRVWHLHPLRMVNGRQIGRPALYSSQLNAVRFLALSPANMDIL
eukprot:5995857-Pleurochrysis_carterae.AAC.1